MKAKYYLLFLLAFTTISCEKVLDIKIDSGEQAIVVEGQIETDGVPFLTLTKSVGFFDKIDFTKINYVTDAVVKVSDMTDNQTISLYNYTIDTVVNGQNFKFSIYGPDLNNFNEMLGENDHIYKLTINHGGKTYESITKIPGIVAPDSVFPKARLLPNTTDSVYEVNFKYNDPDTAGNYFRYKTQRYSINPKYNNDDFVTPENSVFSDAFLNGNTLNLSINLAVSDTLEFDTPEQFFPYIFLTKGDSARVKWMSVDYNTFNFWNTLEFARGSVGNPFSSPIKVQSNISNGAIGIWAGYGITYFTCKAPQ